MADFRYITKSVDVQNKAVLHFGERFMLILPYLKKPVSAEYISSKVKVKPSRLRAVLNKLYNHNLVDYKRSFDDDTGKYTYVWTLKHEKLKEFLKNYEFDVSAEEAVIADRDACPYVCVGCRDGYSFDSATDCSFKCYKCGSFIDAKEK